MLSLSVQDYFRRLIMPELAMFLIQMNYNYDFRPERITLWADTDMFKHKEDEYIWNQAKGKITTTFSVYIDGIHICYFKETDTREKAVANFWKGFLDNYSKPDNDPLKIFIDESIYKEIRDKKNKFDKELKELRVKEIDKIKATTPVEKEAKELAKTIVKESSDATPKLAA